MSAGYPALRKVETANLAGSLMEIVPASDTMNKQTGFGTVADPDPEPEFKECRRETCALMRKADNAMRFAIGEGRGFNPR